MKTITAAKYLIRCFVSALFMLSVCAFGQERPNIVLVVMDTGRLDRFGCYGYAGGTTPNIDALAEESVLFTEAVTPIPTTTPAHASMFSALYPKHHAVLYNGSKMDFKEKVLAEILRENGYTTAGFISVVLLDRYTKMNRGFDTYVGMSKREKKQGTQDGRVVDDDAALRHDGDFHYYQSQRNKAPEEERSDEEDRRKYQRKAKETIDIALRWLDENDKSPFFLWVHLYDPHWPYFPPEGYVNGYDPDTEKWKEINRTCKKISRRSLKRGASDIPELSEKDEEIVNALYDGEIRYADDQLGRLFESLKQKGVYDNSVIIFVTDHGEILGDEVLGRKLRYYGHHRYIFEPSVRIPFLMKVPGMAAKRIDGPVRLIDIMPTLLSYLNIEDKEKRDGMDLMPMIEGGGSKGPGYSYIETDFDYADPRDRQKRTPEIEVTSMKTGIWTGKWKYFRSKKTKNLAAGEFLFDLQEDPNEEKNVITDYPEKANELKDILRPYYRTLVVEKRPRRRRFRWPWERNKAAREAAAAEQERQERERQFKSLGYM